jgi:hypothetical protein
MSDWPIDRARPPWQDDPVRRFVLLSLLGIAILLAGSLAIVVWMTGGGPDAVAPEPAPAAAPVQAETRRPAPVPPPPAATSREVEAFRNPPPKAVPEPAGSPPPVDLAREAPALEALVSRRCGTMRLRLGDEMRKGGEQITGQAVLLFDVVAEGGKVKFGQSRLQTSGNMRQSLVACAQMALRGQVVDAPGARPEERFTVQMVLGMAE